MMDENDSIDRPIWDATMSFYMYPSLCAGDQFGLFAYLDENPGTCERISRELDSNMRSMDIFLTYFVSIGFVVKQGDVYSLSEAGRRYLLPDSPYYWGGVFSLHAPTLPAVDILLTALNWKQDPGITIWDHFSLANQDAGSFMNFLHSAGAVPAKMLGEKGDFSRVSRLLDVAGGTGVFSFAVVQRFEDIRCTIAELSYACKIADTHILNNGMEDRVNTMELDMFHDPWPEGYNGVMFSNVFHNWQEDKIMLLLKKSYDALPSGGQIFICEMLLDDEKTGPMVTAAVGLMMLLSNAGKQYSGVILSDMIERAGFHSVVVEKIHAYYSLITAQKP